MAKRKSTSSSEIVVEEIGKGQLAMWVVGMTPLICHVMSDKARHELFLPKGKKNSAEKAASLKHNPVDEFRQSAYQFVDPNEPTLIGIQSSAFKGALRNAALDLPGSSKSQIGRLTFVEGEYVGVYGLPRLFISVVRSSDMNRTPDIRTRVIIPEWACNIVISFVTPILKDVAVVNLLAAAGITQGVGDWRPEKGKGSYGQFRLAKHDDEQYHRIAMMGGREPQEEAMRNPVPYDSESEKMLNWFVGEAQTRGFKEVIS